MSKTNDQNAAIELKELTVKDLAGVVGGTDDGPGEMEPPDASGDSESSESGGRGHKTRTTRPRSA